MKNPVLIPFGALLAVGMAMTIIGVEENNRVEKILSEKGLHQVHATGFSSKGCDVDETATGFTAVGSDGARVSGVVCGGLWKSTNVHFNKPGR